MTDRTAALKAARAKDSNDMRRRVLQTVNAMESAGEPITAAAVATAAGVSTWLVYADGIREHLDAARARQRQAVDGASPAAAGPRTGQQPVTSAGLRTDSPSLDTRSTGYEQISTNSGADCGCDWVPRSNNPTGPHSSHGFSALHWGGAGFATAAGRVAGTLAASHKRSIPRARSTHVVRAARGADVFSEPVLT